MPYNVLITGGAGFIGSHLTDELIANGHNVVLLDNLHPQVHGEENKTPDYINPKAEFVYGDVRDRKVLQPLLENVDIVFHFAAYTGVGQSMYQIESYMDVNVQSASLLFELLSQKVGGIKKVILASSRAVYGEGLYQCPSGHITHPKPRSLQQFQQEQWDMKCDECGRETVPIPTSEETVPDPASIYAISKLTLEQIGLLIGATYNVPCTALRFFNVFGSRQSLDNPYTGVINTFVTRLVNSKPPQVYEDGLESRDFVHVFDVVQSCMLAMENDAADGKVFNVGSGQKLTLLEVAATISDLLNGPAPVVTGQYRAGDIRHCFADISNIQSKLGYKPQLSFEAGMKELLASLSEKKWVDNTKLAEQELVKRGLSKAD